MSTEQPRAHSGESVDGLRDQALPLLRAGDYAMRSCWECNPAHEHLRKDDPSFLFVCFSCGGWFYRGRDISDRDPGS